MGCPIHGAPRQATVTYGFDFDGTLSVRTHGSRSTSPMLKSTRTRSRSCGGCMLKALLVYVATNESCAHTANWQAARRLFRRAKLRSRGAAESLGDVPLLVVIALTNRRGDCHKRGPNAPTGMWRACKGAQCYG